MRNDPERSPDELVADLGERLQALRLKAGYTQASLADKAGISVRALSDLETGKGSTVATMVRVLKALGAEQGIEHLAPTPQISPMELLKRPKPRQRGYR